MKLPFKLYRVEGKSMLPTYHPGDLLLARRYGAPRLHGVVVARVNERLLIKRLKRIEKGAYWLEGDNLAASTDSRQFGALGREQIEAVIIAKLT